MGTGEVATPRSLFTSPCSSPPSTDTWDMRALSHRRGRRLTLTQRLWTVRLLHREVDRRLAELGSHPDAWVPRSPSCSHLPATPLNDKRHSQDAFLLARHASTSGARRANASPASASCSLTPWRNAVGEGGRPSGHPARRCPPADLPPFLPRREYLGRRLAVLSVDAFSCPSRRCVKAKLHHLLPGDGRRPAAWLAGQRARPGPSISCAWPRARWDRRGRTDLPARERRGRYVRGSPFHRGVQRTPRLS